MTTIHYRQSLGVKRVSSTAKLPTKAYQGDAGWDLYADIEEPIHIECGHRALIDTGCAFAIPEGFYGRIADRSGNAYRFGIHVLGGVVDQAYRNSVKVILVNLDKKEEFIVNPGDKIAQMIVTPIFTGHLIELDEIDETERGQKGFGSSGNK